MFALEDKLLGVVIDVLDPAWPVSESIEGSKPLREKDDMRAA